ncbi:DUF4177 domain-containing protein [Desulfosporosinus youngiae]|uniref:DUF4177 domain-containing protein n=1 Tax=Desulfosporosinus youngiae DSM 17734 TaxID=768710 RepID=H5XUN7_9FIRM|nr:DUF4177 domain-containing protein [Desulfosporosinus youngiae]EHQ89055.1 hypothetical protein DesyoDRAFT_1947 [Desulfosporosinus youngiae DSM 17734]
MDRWEYKTVTFDAKGLFKSKFEFDEFDVELSKLGNEGWELVTMVTPISASGYTVKLVATFKRKK